MTLADIDMKIGLRNISAEKYFSGWLRPVTPDSSAVTVKDEDYAMYRDKWHIPANAYTEYSLMAYRVCDELLKYHLCVFHGTSFLWNGKAFIFTAPSGTGKSTQLFHWSHIYKDEITIMNGDKPVLCDQGDHIMVFPSPWKGKECIGNDTLTAPLGGIIFLEQGSDNHIERMAVSKAVCSLFPRILSTVETAESVQNAGKILETIVLSVPVWKLVNTGDTESAVLTHETLKKELTDNEI